MTPERQAEIKSRIDQRFDQFSLDEARKVVSGEMTSRLAHPGFSILEQEFAEEHFTETPSIPQVGSQKFLQRRWNLTGEWFRDRRLKSLLTPSRM